MLKDYHPIEVLLGQDGSWAVEGVPDGHMGAKKVFRFLLGQEPPPQSYTTNPLWDWFYFPPGSLTEEQRRQILSVGPINEQGSWVYKLHEVPHVDQPGQFTESFFEILKEPVFGRVVAGIVTFVLLGAAGLFWLSTRSPGSMEAGLADVVAAARTPHVSPSFADRFAVHFTDGDRFTVPFTPRDIVHRGSDTVVLAGFGESAFLIESEGVGETLGNELQMPGAALEFDTRGGVDGIYAQKPDGAWVHASVIELTKGNVAPGGEAAQIHFDEPGSFADGTRYQFAGGVERAGGDFHVFALPRIAPPYRVMVTTDDPGLHQLLGYAADRNYTVSVTGALHSLTDAETRTGTRVIGEVGPEIGLEIFRSAFVPSTGR